MKEKHMKQFAGAWVDNDHALIIARPGENENADFAVLHKIEAQHYHGRKGEHASMNAEPQYLDKYHKAIGNALLTYDDILIFGPGKAQEQLVNFLHKDAHFKEKKITLEAAQHMPENQLIARVRDFSA